MCIEILPFNAKRKKIIENEHCISTCKLEQTITKKNAKLSKLLSKWLVPINFLILYDVPVCFVAPPPPPPHI